MGASRTTDLLEFYSEFGPRIGLEKMARAGVDISGDSVSVITSALTIENIDPSSGHFFSRKFWLQLGSIFSIIKTLVITDTESPENIDPSSGHFFNKSS